MKVCECGLWFDVSENSQGDEPFISQTSAITEACSHRHNHLLELLENGSPKWYITPYKAISVGVTQTKVFPLSLLSPQWIRSVSGSSRTNNILQLFSCIMELKENPKEDPKNCRSPDDIMLYTAHLLWRIFNLIGSAQCPTILQRTIYVRHQRKAGRMLPLA